MKSENDHEYMVHHTLYRLKGRVPDLHHINRIYNIKYIGMSISITILRASLVSIYYL